MPRPTPLIAKDRESHGRDLLTAIDAGDFPRWTLFIQVMTEAQAKTARWKILRPGMAQYATPR